MRLSTPRSARLLAPTASSSRNDKSSWLSASSSNLKLEHKMKRCALNAMAQSQASTGQISGLVTDTNGAAVPNATVKATSKDTGLERSVTTSGDGLYTIVLLPPGTYTVNATATGFAAATIGEVVV